MNKYRHLKAAFWNMVSHLPFFGGFRWKIIRNMGVIFVPPKNKKMSIFIGGHVQFDKVYPEMIEIHNHVHITDGCIFLTHYLDTESQGIVWLKGKIIIEEDVFLGTRTIITKPVTIGKNSIVAAGSVVTKDIPPNEIWGGIPAKLIKKRKLL